MSTTQGYDGRARPGGAPGDGARGPAAIGAGRVELARVSAAADVIGAVGGTGCEVRRLQVFFGDVRSRFRHHAKTNSDIATTSAISTHSTIAWSTRDP